MKNLKQVSGAFNCLFRFLAIKYLERDKDIENVVESLSCRDEVIATRFEERKRIEGLLHTSMETVIVDAKYAFIQGALKETYTPAFLKEPSKRSKTDKIDAIVTNRWLAFPLHFLWANTLCNGWNVS